jgi:DNA replication protein DnaC
MRDRAVAGQLNQVATRFAIAVIVTTNLPFSEWSQVIPNPRLCKVLIDRLTDQAHIITTGTDSYRFRRTMAQRKTRRS